MGAEERGGPPHLQKAELKKAFFLWLRPMGAVFFCGCARLAPPQALGWARKNAATPLLAGQARRMGKTLMPFL
jgi:hypothetical protein